MASAPTLGPMELTDALRTVAAVMEDHAAALDRLEVGVDWDGGPDAGAERAGPAAAPPPAAGADLARTIGAAAGAAQQRGPSAGLTGVTEALASAAAQHATGAAGNGAVQVLRGLAEACRNADHLDAQRFAIGLELAAERLAPGDDGAHAGCLPAVVAASADAALAALDAGADLVDVVIAAADDGLAELETGPVANPRLVERGVVDASAAGFLLMLDVLASVMTGEPLPAPPMDPLEVVTPAEGSAVPGRYRVSCVVEPNDGRGLEDANWLESLWHELGELERFDPTGARWQLSLLTPDPGRAIEALFDVGRPRDLKVESVPSAA